MISKKDTHTFSLFYPQSLEHFQCIAKPICRKYNGISVHGSYPPLPVSSSTSLPSSRLIFRPQHPVGGEIMPFIKFPVLTQKSSINECVLYRPQRSFSLFFTLLFSSFFFLFLSSCHACDEVHAIFPLILVRVSSWVTCASMYLVVSFTHDTKVLYIPFFECVIQLRFFLDILQRKVCRIVLDDVV